MRRMKPQRRVSGLETKGTSDPAYWMRTYYRHARTVYRRAILAMEALPPARQSFYRPQRRKRTPIAGTDFVVQDGRVDVSESALLTGPEGILRVFALVAAHGYRLTQNAEDRLADALPVLDVHIPEGPFLWNGLREILLGPHAAHALRTMHALGILELLIPEFHGIDALVIRDSYHRYTVDEHTFLVIDNVHALRQPHLGLGTALCHPARGDRPARPLLPRGADARHGKGSPQRRPHGAERGVGR